MREEPSSHRIESTVDLQQVLEIVWTCRKRVHCQLRFSPYSHSMHEQENGPLFAVRCALHMIIFARASALHGSALISIKYQARRLPPRSGLDG